MCEMGTPLGRQRPVVCPSCGYCPTCGRAPTQTQLPISPQWMASSPSTAHVPAVDHPLPTSVAGYKCDMCGDDAPYEVAYRHYCAKHAPWHEPKEECA